MRLFVSLLLLFVDPHRARTIAKNVNICDTGEDLMLGETAEESSQIIELILDDEMREDSCTLKIEAPESHVVHLQFLEDNLEIHRVMGKADWYKNPPCILSIYLPENEHRPFWSGDICGMDHLPHIDLLTPKIRLSWDPPDVSYHTKGRKIIVTSVGKGNFCLRPDQHTCMRIGWKPTFCISDHLLCDSHQHCPRGSKTSDEDESFCRNYMLNHSSWKQLAVDILKKVQPHNSDVKKLLEQLEPPEETSTQDPPTTVTKRKNIMWKDWKELNRVEGTTKPTLAESPNSSLGNILSQYGPWGYLLLGMVLCGSLLIFCGLWECCIRRHKNEVAAANLATPPTAVLIVNGYEDVQTPQPPEYEDLDLPPSYAALFPSDDKSTDGNDDDDDESRPDSVALECLNRGTNNNGETSRNSGES